MTYDLLKPRYLARSYTFKYNVEAMHLKIAYRFNMNVRLVFIDTAFLILFVDLCVGFFDFQSILKKLGGGRTPKSK